MPSRSFWLCARAPLGPPSGLPGYVITWTLASSSRTVPSQGCVPLDASLRPVSVVARPSPQRVCTVVLVLLGAAGWCGRVPHSVHVPIVARWFVHLSGTLRHCVHVLKPPMGFLVATAGNDTISNQQIRILACILWRPPPRKVCLDGPRSRVTWTTASRPPSWQLCKDTGLQPLHPGLRRPRGRWGRTVCKEVLCERRFRAAHRGDEGF